MFEKFPKDTTYYHTYPNSVVLNCQEVERWRADLIPAEG